MIRLLRPGVGQRLRIWSDGHWPTHHVPTLGVAIEWVGQVGHPTSYVLLGGSPSDQSGVTVSQPGPVFADAFAGAADVVRLGLPGEYRGAVDEVLANAADHARSMSISLAARRSPLTARPARRSLRSVPAPSFSQRSSSA